MRVSFALNRRRVLDWLYCNHSSSELTLPSENRFPSYLSNNEETVVCEKELAIWKKIAVGPKTAKKEEMDG